MVKMILVEPFDDIVETECRCCLLSQKVNELHYSYRGVETAF